MTRVYRLDGGGADGFIVDGHAHYDEPGRDIVCASISVLAINTANAFLSLLPEEDAIVEAGDGFIKLRTRGKPGEKASLLLDAFFMGARGIESQYGKYLKVME